MVRLCDDCLHADICENITQGNCDWYLSEIRWTDKVSVKSNGDIIDFEGRVVGHINLEDIKGGVSYLHQDSITKSVTQIPFPPVNTNAVCVLKCCDTCKYKDKLMTQEPCFSCETKRGWYEKWEAKDCNNG